MDVSQVSPQKNVTPTLTLGAKPASTDKDKSAASTGPKPAATVDISARARARLVAAGASNEAVATTNLKDAGAVARAVNRAKAEHAEAEHHDAEPAKGAPAKAEATTTGEPAKTATPAKEVRK